MATKPPFDAVRSSGLAPDIHLVGRDEELALVGELLERRDLGGVVVTGPAGVGKTMLAREALDAAARAGWAVERVTATRSSGTVALGAFAALLPDRLGATNQAAVIAAVARHLRDRAGDRRLLVGIDDAHHLDDASAALCHLLARPGESAVLVTVRSGERVPDPVTVLWKDGLAERMELQSLARHEIDALAAARLGGPIEPSTAEQLWRWSQGLPLLVNELLRGGTDAGVLARRDGRWRWDGPPVASSRLVELVATRFDRLSSEAIEAVELLALGEPLEAELLRALVGADAIADAERAGLIDIGAARGVVEVRVAHPLYSEVIRDRTPALRTRMLYQRLADALEARGTVRAADILRLATWRLEGGGPVDDEMLARAAEKAETLFDHGLAIRLASLVRDTGGFAALHALGRGLYFSGRGAEADEALAAAERLAPSERSRIQAGITRSSNLYWVCHDRAGALRVLGDADAHATEEQYRQELLAHRASIVLADGAPNDALALVEPWLDAPCSSLAELRGLIVAVPAWAVTGRFRRVQAVFDHALALALAETHALRLAAGQLLVGQCMALLWDGRPVAADALARHAADVARQEGITEAEGIMLLLRALAADGRGDVAAARDLVVDALGWLDRGDTFGFGRFAQTVLARVLGHAGDALGASRAAAVARAGAGPVMRIFDADLLLADAWSAAAAGALRDAAAACLAAADAFASTGQRAREAEALHDAVRVGTADPAAHRLRDIGNAVDGQLMQSRIAHADALRRGDGAALDDVAERFAQLGMMLFAAEAAAQASAAHRERGRTSAARASAARMSVLHTACPGARTPALAAAHAPAELTAREREITQLAARGIPTKEIAAQLGLSARTVDNHLSRAYVKLGVHGRQDLEGRFGPG